MRVLGVVAMGALAAVSAWAGEGDQAAQYTVAVCVAMDRDFAVQRAQTIAGGMFAEIGVRIEWHGERSCPPNAIRISFSDGTNRKFRPEAVAYALPYEATHIEVFYDRLQKHAAARLPVLLAHVMVHEITHILQGVSQHSASGIMMASWGRAESNEMAFKPLRFTDSDVRLIRQGLEARESRLAAAKN
jgi:hypothetical protein